MSESENVVQKGELVEFKPGLFGIEMPENYGIFIRSFKKKNSKDRYVELYTIKGKQETKHTNMNKKSFGEFIQLKNENLPQGNELNKELRELIKRVNSRAAKVQKAEKESGELSEIALWKKLTSARLYESAKAYSVEELAFVWYGVAIEDLSKNRIKKIKETLESCRHHGQGYFSLQSGNLWWAITDEIRKSVSKEIGELGAMRNKMFHLVEMPVEDSDDPEETEIRRMPLDWDKILFNDAEKGQFSRLQQYMAYFVENDDWSELSLGGTFVWALDGFSLKNYMSYLAEDWVNEGSTSFSDCFVKLLIRTGYWNDSDALLSISKRVVKLAPHFEWETDERIEEIAAKFVEPKETPEVFEGRTDLQHLESYTIDPPTAKDFDDAVAYEITNYGFTLWVHIADVAHYVEKDSSLDIHARGRATSVYLPTKTIPMLPTHLSDNLCSLNEKLPRLAMTVEIHYDKEGKKLFDKCKVHNSVIMVKKNLSYDYVNEQIEAKAEPFTELYKLSELIRKHRRSLNLETDDVRLELTEQMSVSIKTPSPSTKMIEAFMVAANETVAEILQEKSIPVIYRGHPLPDKPNVDRLNAHSKVLNFDINVELPKLEEEKEEEGTSLMDMLSQRGGGNISFTIGGDSDFADQFKSKMEEEPAEDLGPLIKGLAQLSPENQEAVMKPFLAALAYVEKIEDETLQKVGYLTILRTLSRALYSPTNFGHFGLGSTAYLHFTSPIRRYPDVIAHRVCKALIADEPLVYSVEELDTIAEHCNVQSELAERLERNVVGAGFSFLTRNPKYSENKQGVVISITGGAIYVLLPNGIEVKVPLKRITTRATFVDEYASMCFVGFKTIDHIAEEVTVENWRDLLQDNAEDDPVEIIAKLGDKMAVDFVGWNHIDGIVEAAPSL